tara:strand:+ start:10296 stop:10490 length:195 start_codon:yes stop_codon:yes gene_type:complete
MELISTLGQALFGVLMDKCRNCGHDSHCGVPLYKDFRPEGKGIQGQIEVCKHCRCPKCTIPDWG